VGAAGSCERPGVDVMATAGDAIGVFGIFFFDFLATVVVFFVSL
jgi:hypothetical protein